mmetsp:Transcript_23569/g.38727  ORF Transcript_23569/g.38727 Transcript_23569/m.38727 type:complete len:323 (+) Transcript_23569:93-1061(+)
MVEVESTRLIAPRPRRLPRAPESLLLDYSLDCDCGVALPVDFEIKRPVCSLALDYTIPASPRSFPARPQKPSALTRELRRCTETQDSCLADVPLHQLHGPVNDSLEAIVFVEALCHEISEKERMYRTSLKETALENQRLQERIKELESLVDSLKQKSAPVNTDSCTMPSNQSSCPLLLSLKNGSPLLVEGYYPPSPQAHPPRFSPVSASPSPSPLIQATTQTAAASLLPSQATSGRIVRKQSRAAEDNDNVDGYTQEDPDSSVKKCATPPPQAATPVSSHSVDIGSNFRCKLAKFAHPFHSLPLRKPFFASLSSSSTASACN